MIQILYQILYILFTSYVYLHSMILSYLYLQNYFQNFPSFKSCSLFFRFQAWRLTAPVDRSIPGQTGQPTGRSGPVSRTCTLVHVCRSTDRTTDQKQCALCFFSVGRPVDRLQKTVLCLFVRSIDRSIEAPRALCQQG